MLIAWRRLPETNVIQFCRCTADVLSAGRRCVLKECSQSMLSACIKGTELLAKCCKHLIGIIQPRIDVACCTPRNRKRDEVEIWKVAEAAREDFVIAQP